MKYTINLYKVNAGPFHLKSIAHKYLKVKIDDEMVQSAVEEVTGALAYHTFIAAFTITAGGLAILANPILGAVILTVSIAYGGCVKVYSGKMIQRRIKRKKGAVDNIDTSNFEENLAKYFKSLTSSKLVHVGTTKYMLSRISSHSPPSSPKNAPTKAVFSPNQVTQLSLPPIKKNNLKIAPAPCSG